MPKTHFTGFRFWLLFFYFPLKILCDDHFYLLFSHERETTHWDHPDMIELMKSLADLNEIRFSAYRTAMKLRSVQKSLGLDRIPMSAAIESFDNHGLRAQNDKLIDIPDMTTVLHSLYVTLDKIDLTKSLDLAINWILNVYDSQRTGQIRVLSFKVGHFKTHVSIEFC